MDRYLLEIVRQKWKLVSVIIALLLLNGIITAVVTVYQIPQLSELQTERGTLQRQLTISGKAAPAALYQQGSSDLETLAKMIPEKKQFARVLSGLLEAASDSGVETGAISYKPAKVKEEPLLSYQLSFSVNGSYAAVKSYLDDIQNNQELVVVDSVTFANSDLFVENVVMDLRVTVYLREGT